MVKMTEFKYLQYYIDEKPLYPMISRDVEIYAFFSWLGVVPWFLHLLLLWLLWDWVSCIPVCPCTPSVVWSDLEFLIFLPPLPKFWSYRNIVQIIPGPYIAVSQTQGFVHQVKHSTNWATSWALSFAFHKTEFHLYIPDRLQTGDPTVSAL